MKKILGLSLLTVLVFALTACGQSKEEKDLKAGMDMINGLMEATEDYEEGNLSGEEYGDAMINNFADSMYDMMEDTEEALTEEEREKLKEGMKLGQDLINSGMTGDEDGVEEAMKNLEELDKE